MIILSKHIDSVTVDADEGAVCVRHRKYPKPQTGPGCVHVTHEQLAEDPSVISGKTLMVVVGLGKIATPGNRTRVGPVLWGKRDGLRRVSIDRALFFVDPWRAWWHFGAVGAPYLEYTYSYLAESHWKAAQDGIREHDPFSAEQLCACGEGVIRCDYDRYFDPMRVERVDVGSDARKDYQAIKAKAFDEEHTAPAIIKRLSDFAQQVCPERTIPQLARLWERDAHRIVQTDLGVDDWLVGQIRQRVEITNAIATRFHCAS